MKVVYRGECEELYGREIEVPDHECAEYLTHREQERVEVCEDGWGADYRFEEWWECAVCKAHYTETEAAEMIVDMENGK